MTDKPIRIILDTRQAKKNADQLSESTKDIGRSADSSAFSVKRLAVAIAGVISVQKVAQYADAWTKVQNQLSQTTKGSEDLARVTTRLFDIANETRSGILETSQLYTRFRLSIDEATLSNERLFGVVETINKTLALSGATASEAAGALLQLSQAVGSGALRGQEFNSVAEQAPGILRAISAETGMTVGELRKFAEQGGITSELLISSLENYRSKVDEAFDGTKVSIGQALTVSSNNITMFVGKLDDATGASEKFGRAIIEATSAIGEAETIKTLISVLEALTVVIGTRLAVALLSSAKAFIAQQAAALGATAAISTTTRSVSIYTGAVSTATTVTGGTTVAMNVMAASARAASGALAFLGGPVGVLAIAAASLVYYATKADDAADATDILARSTKDLTRAQADAQRLDATDALRQQERAAVEAEKKIRELEKAIAELSNPRKFQQQAGSLFGSGGANEVFNEQKLKAANDELIRTRLTFENAEQKAAQLRDRIQELNSAIAGEAPRTKKIADEAEPSGISREVQNARQITAALKAELDARSQSAQIYRDQVLANDENLYLQQLGLIAVREAEELARLEAKAATDAQRREEVLARQLESDKIAEDQKKILRDEFKNQELISEQIFEQEKTRILQEASKARQDLERAEYNARLAMVGQFGSDVMTIAQGQSKGLFQIGKAAALSSATVEGYHAAVSAWEKGMQAGGPPLAAGFLAASVAKTGALIKGITSQKFGSGGGSISAGGGATSGVASPATPTTAQQVELAQQRTIIDLRGIGPDTLVTGAQLKSVLERDDSVVVAFENARIEAQRRNVIGVDG